MRSVCESVYLGIMRLLVRKVVTWVFVGVILAIVVAVAAEWFIEVARDKGLFKDAGEKWDHAMGLISSYATSAWILYPLTLLGGCVIGLWTDYFLRRKELEASSGEPEAPTEGIGLEYFSRGVTTVADEEDEAARRAQELYETWDGVDPLTVMEAACLWAGCEPFAPFHLTTTPSVYPRYKALRQGIQKKEIALSTPNKLHALMEARRSKFEEVHGLELTRETIRNFIEEKGFRPAPFVFPEDR